MSATIKQTEQILITFNEKKKNNTIHSAVIKKKKPKNVVLPTINTSTTTNLNEGVAEPELELK